MPEISGVDLLRRLKELKIGMPVIVITGHGDVQLAVEAMKIGAVDFIEKPFDDERLLTAVRSALGRWEKGSQQEAERASLLDKLATLSSREREVLEGLVAGKPNKIIAFDLGISPRTVEIYRANVMTKMDAGSLSELVRMALVAGILKPRRRIGDPMRTFKDIELDQRGEMKSVVFGGPRKCQNQRFRGSADRNRVGKTVSRDRR